MTVAFQPWPKTPRYFKTPVLITEKIDGTNAAINMVKVEDLTDDDKPNAVVGDYALFAQSRNRMLSPDQSDNFDFAAWVTANAETLVNEDLCVGIHYGEWFGKGIGREYGLEDRYLALFSSRVMGRALGREGGFRTPNLRTVPIMHRGVIGNAVNECLADLKHNGSLVNRDFKNPEGIIVLYPKEQAFHKVTLDNNDKGKWESL